MKPRQLSSSGRSSLDFGWFEMPWPRLDREFWVCAGITLVIWLALALLCWKWSDLL